MVPIAPADPVEAVKLNAMLQMGAGGLLAAGIVPRLAAMALAGSTVLTTVGRHRFWELDDQARNGRRSGRSSSRMPPSWVGCC